MHMRRPERDPAPFSLSRASPRRSLWQLLRARIEQWRRQRLAAEELAGLSDHMLADIGLTRWEVEAGGRGRPPRARGALPHPRLCRRAAARSCGRAAVAFLMPRAVPRCGRAIRQSRA